LKKNKELTILLLHSIFIIKDDIINLFKKQIFNYHLGSLPQQRGAAPGTWQTLMTKKSSKMAIHRITNKIDRGNIILSKTLNIKKNQSLKNYYYQVQKMEYNFFKNFFINCYKNKFGQKQKENQSIYMPRLNSKIHGYINWSWNGKEIYNFIRSFDFPFSGAKTFIGRNEVVISDVHLLKKKINFHPFQSGIIFRKEKNFYFIACKDYVLKTNSIKTSEGKKIKSKLLGKRLYTPYPILDNMMTSISVQTPSKDIVKHLKINFG
jgi:methionyl-tRNA formyltransferase